MNSAVRATDKLLSGRLILSALLAIGLVDLACAQATLSTEQITASLSTAPVQPLEDDEEGGLPGRRLASAPRPDPVSRLCEPRPQSMGGEGAAGEVAFRNLVVRPAPTVSLTVEFDFGKSTLRPEGIVQLDALAAALASPALSSNPFIVTGHTDAVGAADINDRLSCARALAAKNYLVDRHRIASHRLVSAGMGASDLLDRANPTAAANRRVVVKRLDSH